MFSFGGGHGGHPEGDGLNHGNAPISFKLYYHLKFLKQLIQFNLPSVSGLIQVEKENTGGDWAQFTK